MKTSTTTSKAIRVFKGIVIDAKNYLKLSPETYDLIMNDSIHPVYMGNASLYTREYFASVRAHLNPHGIATSWIPLFNLSSDAFRMMVRTFVDVFPNSALFYSPSALDNKHALILGRVDDRPILGIHRIENRMLDPKIVASLKEIDVDEPVDFVQFLLLGKEGLRSFTHGAPINTDNHPYLEFQGAQSPHAYTPWQDNLKRIVVARESPLPYIDLAGLADPDGFREKALQRYTASGRVCSAIAVAKISQARAEKWLQAVLSEQPNLVGAHSLIQARRQGEQQSCALEGEAPPKATRMDRAMMFVNAGNLVKAIELLDEEIAENPDNAMAQGKYGAIEWHRGNPAKAVGYLERAIALEPKNAATIAFLGKAFYDLGLYPKAEAAFLEASKVDPKYDDPLVGLGMTYVKMGRREEAEAKLLQALERNPAHVQAMNEYAVLLMSQGNMEQAQRHLKKAIELDPDFPDPHGNLGMIYLKAGDIERAKEMFKRVLVLDPQSGLARMLLQRLGE